MNIPFIKESTLEALGLALVVFLVGWLLITIIVHITRRVLKKSTLDPSVYVILIRVVRITLWILLILTIMSTLHIKMAPFVAVLATGGAAIALALKDSLGNVAGGIILLFTKPFLQGDEIEMNGIVGVVDHIDLLTTTMHTYDNREIIIPNGTITTSVVINSTKRNIRRVDCAFHIGYDANVEKAKDILRDVVRDGPLLLNEPEPWIGLDDLGDSALKLDLKVWCATENRFEVKVYLEETVKRRFEAEGISIPYPKVDVNILNGNGKK